MRTHRATAGVITAAMTLSAAAEMTLPAAFVLNQGQWETAVRFMTRRGPVTAVIETRAMVVNLPGASVRMTFEDADDEATVTGESRRAERYNFFVGDAGRWRSGVDAFDSVLYRDLYDGVDVRVRDNMGLLEYDLLLEPGADLGSLIIRCDGISSLEVDDEGGLVMQTAAGPLRQMPPVAWYELGNGERRAVTSRFCIIDRERFGFEVPQRDYGLPLVVDPCLEWSTFLGAGNFDRVVGVDADQQGVLTIAGTTASLGFPTTGGAMDETHNGIGANGWGDGFVARMNPNLPPANQLVWATFLGGSNDDSANNVIVDVDGTVVVSGWTNSIDFPTTPGSFDETFNGVWDIFVARLDSTGSSLLWSTLIGGTGVDFPPLFHTMDIHEGLIAVVGNSLSSDFPTTPGCYDDTYNGAGPDGWGDAVVACFDSTLSGIEQLVYASYLGGPADESADALAFDATGRLVIAGFTSSSEADMHPTVGAYDPTFNGGSATWPTDGFVALIDPIGDGANDLLYLTYLGGTSGDGINAISVDATGLVTVIGSVESADFPVTDGAYDESYNGGWDAFVSQLRLDGNGDADLIYSTYLGGANGYDYGYNLVVDDQDRILVTGVTASSDFPTTPDACDDTLSGGSDTFVTRIDPALADVAAVLNSTLLGGSVTEAPRGIDTSVPGRVAVVGRTESPNFPTVNAYDATYGGAWDGYVAILNFCPADLDADGAVGITDLLALLANWGPCGICPPFCTGDLDEDCFVGITDLLALLAAWGPC